VDAWQGIDARREWTVPAKVWTYPIETVSQSEGGFEAVYQSTIVLPRWQVRLNAGQRWALHIRETAGEMGSERA
jgi:alpha-amylase